MKTTIISDIHLGSDCCQAKMVEDFLNTIEQNQRLILNGDVFDSIDFRRLKKHHWNILSKIRKLSDKVEIIWVVNSSPKIYRNLPIPQEKPCSYIEIVEGIIELKFHENKP